MSTRYFPLSRCWSLGLLLGTCLLHSVSATEVAVDRRVFAETVASQIASDIESQPGRNVQVGVLPFGDKGQQSSAMLGNIPLELQGEMIRALRLQAGMPGVQIPTAPTVTRLIQRATSSVLDLLVDHDGRNQFLDAVGLDYAVWGEIQLERTSDLLEDPGKSVEIRIFMASRLSARLHKYSGWLDKGDFSEVLPLTGPPVSEGLPEFISVTPPVQERPRFFVEILDESEVPLPMQFVADPNSEFHNSLYLQLPSELKNTPFSIRLSDLGGRPVGVTNAALDGRRLHQAVLKIDGVGSIWPRTGDRYEPASEHPFHSHKWVLTPPGTVLAPDASRLDGDLRGARLVDSGDGPDGSVLRIDGFQAGTQAHQFVFAADPRESLALTRGIGTNDIGLITVHFYAQQFSVLEDAQNYFFNLYHRISYFGLIKNGASNSAGIASTKLGRQLKSPTFTVDFDIVPQPVQVWRIFYRYGDRPLREPDGRLVALRPLSVPRS